MAHMLSSNNGRVEMAYTGETPWHGLGTRVEGLQTADAMLEKAGLLWTVSTAPIYLGTGEPVPGYVALRRDDKAITFGIVTERYHPIQNTQAGDVMDALIGAGANVEVAGALDQGQRCWMLAQLPDTFEVVPGDVIKPYMLLAWGHDGKHGLAGKTTTTRVVCNNTLTAVLGDKWSAAADIYIRHSANASIRIDEALKALGLAKKQGAATAEAYRALAARELTDGEARDYFATVFPYSTTRAPFAVESAPAAPTTETAEEAAIRLLGSATNGTVKAIQAQASESMRRTDETREILARLLVEGKGADLAGHTAWGAYNAVTEYVDHVYPVLKSGQVSARRQQAVAFGGYADLKARALSAGLELAK